MGRQLVQRFVFFFVFFYSYLFDPLSFGKNIFTKRGLPCVSSDWLAERNEGVAFEYLTAEELALILRQFYGEVNPQANSKTGTYSRSSLVGIRAGLNRYLQGPPFNRTLNIVVDREFIPANKILTGRIKLNRSEGHDVTKHKTAISSGDIQRMYSSGVLGNDNPISLQNKVFFELCLHFGRRGKEGLHALKKNSFEFVVDDCDPTIQYATLNFNEKTKKNHGLDAKRKENDQRMYSLPDDANCPIKSLHLYLSKLHPECDSFFQRPRSGDKVVDEDIWYFNKTVGVNTLGEKMKKISEKAELSQIYTNHCIRATTSTVLSHSSFNQNDIISVTGHKDPKSLLPYVASTGNEQRKKMSNTLHNYGKVNQLQDKPHTITTNRTTSTQNIDSNLTLNYSLTQQRSTASDLANQIFQGNTITGGIFNINFNFEKM